MCVCVWIPALSSVDLCGAPLLILSQNGCCQADKFPNGALMRQNSELIASNMKSLFIVCFTVYYTLSFELSLPGQMIIIQGQ